MSSLLTSRKDIWEKSLCLEVKDIIKRVQVKKMMWEIQISMCSIEVQAV